MKLHPSITEDRIIQAIETDDMEGICTACGESSSSPCEPDARNYECDSCGEFKVYGASELLFHLPLI